MATFDTALTALRSGTFDHANEDFKTLPRRGQKLGSWLLERQFLYDPTCYRKFREALVEGIAVAREHDPSGDEIVKWLKEWDIPFLDNRTGINQTQAFVEAGRLDGTGREIHRYLKVSENGTIEPIPLPPTVADMQKEALTGASRAIAFRVTRCGMWDRQHGDTFIFADLCIVMRFHETSTITTVDTPHAAWDNDTAIVFENVDLAVEIREHPELRPEGETPMRGAKVTYGYYGPAGGRRFQVSPP